MRSMRVMCATVMLLAVLVPMQAGALVNSQCGGSHAGTTSCMFTAVGPNLSVSGSTSGNGVTVRITDLSGNVSLLSCTGQFSCNSSAGIPPTGTDSVGPPQGVGPLLCTVTTSGSGFYRCQSTI